MTNICFKNKENPDIRYSKDDFMHCWPGRAGMGFKELNI